jgi:hypothetical protein
MTALVDSVRQDNGGKQVVHAGGKALQAGARQDDFS